MKQNYEIAQHVMIFLTTQGFVKYARNVRMNEEKNVRGSVPFFKKT